MSAQSPFVPDACPGTYDFRGGDCDTHGANVAVYRAHKSAEPFRCVECASSAQGRLVQSPESARTDSGGQTMGEAFDAMATQQAAARAELGIVAGDWDDSWKL